MAFDWLSLPVVVAGISVLLSVVLMLALVRVARKLALNSDHQRQQQRQVEKEHQKQNKQILELRSVLVGLGHKVNQQQSELQLLNERIAEIENADKDGRLYSRANKMVQLGADINEIIEECELPKAEAELMLSLQKKMAAQSSKKPRSSSPSRTQRSSVDRQR
ncbi:MULTISPECIES: DUF2802 domain-containing protein [unclassified Vibrio]|uniref:DUF2802 domain-containing protein n=1 Tax=Vibrio sp. HB236076 TaxID=3232307 RepID=A0AB39HIL4_9VIBR|nr:DUF2802 domain-containing protein [Vibrio sp. HB161653]MDP5254775.1 DUF2802 domain-containing protein [Vibrio sp. HB161653]